MHDQKQFEARYTADAKTKEEFFACADEIKIDYNQDGTLSFESFLEIKKLNFEYIFKQNFEQFEKLKTTRRELLAKGKGRFDIDDYNGLMFERIGGGIISEGFYVNALLKHVKVPTTVFDKSMKTFMQEPEKNKEHEEAM